MGEHFFPSNATAVMMRVRMGLSVNAVKLAEGVNH